MKTEVSEIDFLGSFFDEHLCSNWQELAYETGAFTRKRCYQNPLQLLSHIFFHISEDFSYRDTTFFPPPGKESISDVAIMKRLRKSRRWLELLVQDLLSRRFLGSQSGAFRVLLNECFNRGQYVARKQSGKSKYRFICSDASVVTNPRGKNNLRLHSKFSLNEMKIYDLILTTDKIAESEKHFKIQRNEVSVDDRGYCNVKGVSHIVGNGGSFILRAHSRFPLHTLKDEKIDYTKHLSKIKNNEVVEMKAKVKLNNNKWLKGRFIALRLPKKKAEQAKKRTIQKRNSKNKKPLTILASEFVILFTNLPDKEFSTEEILMIYRFRWQIELLFKRMKTLFKIGNVPNQNQECAFAWVYAKILYYLLIEETASCTDDFILPEKKTYRN